MTLLFSSSRLSSSSSSDRTLSSDPVRHTLGYPYRIGEKGIIIRKRQKPHAYNINSPSGRNIRLTYHHIRGAPPIRSYSPRPILPLIPQVFSTPLKQPTPYIHPPPLQTIVPHPPFNSTSTPPPLQSNSCLSPIHQPHSRQSNTVPYSL